MLLYYTKLQYFSFSFEMEKKIDYQTKTKILSLSPCLFYTTLSNSFNKSAKHLNVLHISLLRT